MEDGKTQDWLDNADWEDIFIEYLNYLDKNHIKNATKWLSDLLYDIESKVNAKDVDTGDKENPYRYRTDDEKEEFRELLFDEKVLNDEDFFTKHQKEKVKNR